MKSPCRTCIEYHDGVKCEKSESCADLELFQRAVLTEDRLGQPKPGQCLICREKNEADYCERCRRSVGRALSEKTEIKQVYEDRAPVKVCQCGKQATHRDMCQKCYNHSIYKKLKDGTYRPPAGKKRKFRVCIVGRRLKRDRICMFCHEVITDKVHLFNHSTGGFRLYAHCHCGEADPGAVIIAEMRAA